MSTCTAALREAAEHLDMNDLKSLLRKHEISLPQFVELSSLPPRLASPRRTSPTTLQCRPGLAPWR